MSGPRTNKEAIANEQRSFRGQVYQCMNPGDSNNGGVWKQIPEGYLADYTICCQLDKYGITVKQPPETASPISSRAPIDNNTSAPNYYHQLKYLLGNMDQLVHWAAIDREASDFSIVDRDWTIYNTINTCYNNCHAQDLLKVNGILISVEDIEDSQAIYLISYTK